MTSIEKAIGQVVILHMTNGQPVIGKLAAYDADDNGIVMHKAMELNFVPNPRSPSQVGVQYTPFLAFGGILPPLENMPISLADTLLMRSGAQVPKTIEDGYLQATTGIATAPAGAERAFSLVKP